MTRNAARLSLSRRRPVRFAAEYARSEEPPAEVVIPEDLTALSDDDLDALLSQAVDAFHALYGDGTGLSDEDVEALRGLTEGIDALRVEASARAEAATARDQAAADLAARVSATPEEPVENEPVTGDDGAEEGDGTDEGGDESAPPAEAEVTPEGDALPEPIAASGSRRDIRVNLGGLRSRQARTPTPRPANAARGMRDLVTAAPDIPGFSAGHGMDWADVGVAVDRRLGNFNAGQFEAAHRSGRHLRQQFGVAVIAKPFAEDLMIRGDDPAHIDEVLSHAMDEHRLPGGSLVASGGWCAPSETIYDLCELESRDGLLSLPEVGVARGGFRRTMGPDFSTIYANTGFCYTEDEDIDGNYDGQGGGSKPCYRVECPPFEEFRLDLCGLCITAGLLQQRGYPEVIARTVRGALVAHDHKMSAKSINQMVDDSTPVSIPADQAGATAPILTAIELQVEHYRYTHRAARSTTLEAVFPYWVRGAIRSDLSRRLGVDLISVPDSRIAAWFAERGVNPQYVYDWQALDTTAASGFTSWPTTVDFLLYGAGTWVRGGSEVITLDTIYDSVLLGQNDYTALFTEEGTMTVQMCQDSRVVTVPICPDGATHLGVEIDCDGTEA